MICKYTWRPRNHAEPLILCLKEEEINAESDRKNDEETIEAMASYSAVKG